MAECDSPDRLSILTYLAEFYHKFKSEKSPPISKKKEEANLEDKPGSDLKRKDSCDSGVSVSPLGSVCNSPPPLKKDSPPTHLPAPPPPPAPVLQSPILKTDVSGRLSEPCELKSSSISCNNSPSAGLDNLLRQRLNISLGSPQSKPKMTQVNSERERRNLLKSMISVSGSDHKSKQSLTVPDRRRSLDPSFRIQSSDLTTQRNEGETRQLGRVSELTESLSQPNPRYVSCTTISLSPSHPVKYSLNNSVTCDVKNAAAARSFIQNSEFKTQNSDLKNGGSAPRPWRENKSDKNCGVSVPAGQPGQSHLVQVKVNTDREEREERDDREDLNSNIKAPSDAKSSFKSRMMKFEQMISGAGARDDIGINVSEARRRVNLTCNQENDRYPVCTPVLKDVRRKSISAFPPSFTVRMSEDSKLTF